MLQQPAAAQPGRAAISALRQSQTAEGAVVLTGLQAGSSYDLTAAAHDASSAPVAATAGSYTFSSDGGGGGGAATAPPAQPSIDEPRTVVGASNVTVGGVSGGGGGTGVALWTVVAVPTEGTPGLPVAATGTTAQLTIGELPPGVYLVYAAATAAYTSSATEMLESIGDGGSDLLQSKLASLAAAAQAQRAAATSELHWAGESYRVREDKIRIPLTQAQELEAELEGAMEAEGAGAAAPASQPALYKASGETHQT
ncbi:signal recognition particle subunit SRP68 [Micractinium conductrix]|uniref:Signal recognition particle subunit SRP68 n=1 Tax=Micractinium conductrix TaxID=554055 RepID=A0A2P6V2I8_9CHLO|nr:signal recognition particle subunit SRP68 [Micractinium conductrix]|eukprot:PSC68303.1 signal recognition particle subunit SRP68 [Micractinium conductrix]